MSSGDNNRHRLNRGGTRRLNHALHIAVVQYRMPGPLLPELPQLPTESPGWTWFPTMSVAGQGADARAGCRGPVGLDPMTTGAAIAAGAPAHESWPRQRLRRPERDPARRWSMPIFMAVFGPKMLMIEGGACAVLRRCRQ